MIDRSQPPTPGPVRRFRFPDFHRDAGDDAPTVFTLSAPGVGLVQIELLTPAGARFDPSGRAGLAALTGALLDEGTPTKTSTEIAALAERMGGYLGTGTNWNCTSISMAVQTGQLEAAFELLGEVVREPTLPEDELERLRERTLAEIQRRVMVPSALASLQFAAALFPHHVFGKPILGTAESVEAISRNEIETFYQQSVVAAPLQLIAVGEVDAKTVRSLTESHLGGLPRRPSAEAPPEPSEDAAESRVFLVDRPGAAQTELRIGHLGVPRSHPDFTALSVMNSLLGGKFTSRLILNLRERHGLTYGIRSSLSRRLGIGPFSIASAVATDGTARAVTEVRAELLRLQQERVTAAEIEETQSYILGVFPYTVQGIDGLSHRLREIAVHDLPLDHWDRYPDEVRAVTADEVLRVARTHLRPEELTIVAVGPEAELRPQLESFGELRVWRPADSPDPVSG